MKKSIIVCLLIIGTIFSTQYYQKAQAQQVTSQDIGSIERLFFNQTYNSAPIEQRLARIENMIYGQSFSNESVEERMGKLSNFVPKNLMPAGKSKALPVEKNNHEPLEKLHKSDNNNNIDLPGLMSANPTGKSVPSCDYLDGTLPPRNQTIFTEDRPQKIASANTGRKHKKTHPHYEEVPPEQNPFNKQKPEGPDYSSYPAVDEAEQLYLGQSFAGEDVYKRLDRLETTLYGQKSNASLYDRVEAIAKEARYNKLKEKFAKQYTPVTAKPSINTVTPPMTGTYTSPSYQNPNTLNNFENPAQQQNYNGSSEIYDQQRGLNSYQTYRQSSTNSGAGVMVQPGQATIPPPQMMVGSSFGFKKQELSSLEQQIFGKTFDDDLSMSRIDRLEKKVCGKTTFGLLDERLKRVEDVMAGRKKPGNKVITTKSFYTPPNPYHYGYSNPYTPAYAYAPPPAYQHNPQAYYNQQAYQNQQAYNQGYGYNPYPQVNPYGGYAPPMYGVPRVPTTPQGIARAAANTAIDKTIGSKSGTLAQIGKMAGSALLGGVPSAPYNYYNPY